jgi:hypothetical protein
MRISQRIIVGVLALLLLTVVSPASADGGGTTEKTNSRETVSFSLKAGPEGCPLITSTLTGTGKSDNTIKTTTFANGSRQVVDDKEVNGKAIDASGKSYKFQYLHHGVFTQSADRMIIHADFTDSFVVVKSGKDNLLEVRFHWLFTYTPADTNALPSPATMPFPPTDNWVDLGSIGDPLHCDPL